LTHKPVCSFLKERRSVIASESVRPEEIEQTQVLGYISRIAQHDFPREQFNRHKAIVVNDKDVHRGTWNLHALRDYPDLDIGFSVDLRHVCALRSHGSGAGPLPLDGLLGHQEPEGA
jgi:hypothetical protein